ncbi:hypothetical protein BBP40_011762, partial [Aspergillus hancockii]
MNLNFKVVNPGQNSKNNGILMFDYIYRLFSKLSGGKPTKNQATMMPDSTHLHIIIVGAGLSGLATAISCALSGHTVTVGAGLQITPNASRLLRTWSLPSTLWTSTAEPTTLTVHAYTGKILAHEPAFSTIIRQKYSAPFIDLHRVDLQQALFTRAKQLGVTFHLNQRVENIDFESTTVHTLSGATFTGDLIVAADGLWSKCRECYLGRRDDPLPTGDLAYRIVLRAEEIGDEGLRKWVESPQCHFWVGPGAHVVAYSVRGGRMFNIVLLVPDDLPEG